MVFFIVGLGNISAVEVTDQKEIVPGKLYYDIGSSYAGKTEVRFYDKDKDEIQTLHEKTYFFKRPGNRS